MHFVSLSSFVFNVQRLPQILITKCNRQIKAKEALCRFTAEANCRSLQRRWTNENFYSSKLKLLMVKSIKVFKASILLIFWTKKFLWGKICFLIYFICKRNVYYRKNMFFFFLVKMLTCFSLGEPEVGHTNDRIFVRDWGVQIAFYILVFIPVMLHCSFVKSIPRVGCRDKW